MKINLSSALIRQYVIIIIVNFGALTTGMSLGWPSPVIVKLRNGTDTPLSRPITEVEGSWIISGGYLMVVGTNILGGMLIDRIGRKYCFILVSVPKLLLSIWTIFVTEVWMIIFCRVVMVVCDCFVMVVVPVYAAEIACSWKTNQRRRGKSWKLFKLIFKSRSNFPNRFYHLGFNVKSLIGVASVAFNRYAFHDIQGFIECIVDKMSDVTWIKEHRGFLGTFINIFLYLGTLISLSIGPFLSYAAFNIFIAALIAVTTLPAVFLPDSPFYLYNKGYTNDAITALSVIRDSDVIIKKELQDYRLSSMEDNIDIMGLLKNKLYIKAILLGTLLCAGSNVIGYNAVTFYLQTILESTETSLQPEIASAVIGGIQVFGAFCTSFIMKKFGRRPILLVSLFGMCCGMVGLGAFFTIVGNVSYTVSGFMNYLPLVSLIVVIYCYSIGIGNLMFVVTTELFDGPARAVGFSVCLIPSALLTFLLSKYFAQITTALGPAPPYYFFSAMCVLVMILVMIFLPETKGKTFNEIQTDLEEKLVHIQCTSRKSGSQ